MNWSLTSTMYSLYLVLSIAVTVWVARTLFRNGRTFLVDAFHGDERLADSVNHLLVVGFYLVNIGFICFYLATDRTPGSVEQLFELLSKRMGVVLLALGVMHFVNVMVFSKMRTRAKLMSAPPPVEPSERIAAVG
jgi:hypothetical protein